MANTECIDQVSQATMIPYHILEPYLDKSAKYLATDVRNRRNWLLSCLCRDYCSEGWFNRGLGEW